ncbi:hypothetical protein FA13DRAFT_1712376 [Coprinellus micaceus]|uniref:Uncharacterized protein n=1 Tax=Coprinellus micaceus TaxID=71717 RepID=A0A4Y7T0I7_COPMI|nr:hypothetical protein FA13DRAFT_1712376 [Coprinellus micaceus]
MFGVVRKDQSPTIWQSTVRTAGWSSPSQPTEASELPTLEGVGPASAGVWVNRHPLIERLGSFEPPSSHQAPSRTTQPPTTVPATSEPFRKRQISIQRTTAAATFASGMQLKSTIVSAQRSSQTSGWAEPRIIRERLTVATKPHQTVLMNQPIGTNCLVLPIHRDGVQITAHRQRAVVPKDARSRAAVRMSCASPMISLHCPGLPHDGCARLWAISKRDHWNSHSKVAMRKFRGMPTRPQHLVYVDALSPNGGQLTAYGQRAVIPKGQLILFLDAVKMNCTSLAAVHGSRFLPVTVAPDCAPSKTGSSQPSVDILFANGG